MKTPGAGFCMSILLIPRGKYKEPDHQDTVCLVLLNTDQLSSQVAGPPLVFMSEASPGLPTIPPASFGVFQPLQSQQCARCSLHTPDTLQRTL